MENRADYIERGKGQPPVVLIVGSSGSGKTSVLVKLIPELRERGLKIGTIKHHHRDFEIDHPGKDSWQHKQAGAERAMISSPKRIGIVMDADHDHALDELIPFFTGLDIVLVEGYKKADRPKVEVFRHEVHNRPVCIDDKYLIAIVSDQPLEIGVPCFGTGDITGLSKFLISRFKLI